MALLDGSTAKSATNRTGELDGFLALFIACNFSNNFEIHSTFGTLEELGGGGCFV